MIIDFLIYSIILSVLILFEVLQDRAFLITQELFPKKEDAPVLYALSLTAKIILLIICIFKIFKV